MDIMDSYMTFYNNQDGQLSFISGARTDRAVQSNPYSNNWNSVHISYADNWTSVSW